MKRYTKNKGHLLLPLFILFGCVGLMMSCTHEDILNLNKPNVPALEPLSKQVRVQVAYDDTDVAFKFTWKTQQKLYPAGFSNVTKNYPMQFHDMLKHNGTKFDRLASGTRLEEDRISFIIDNQTTGIVGFSTMGCAVSCHTDMTDHHLLSNDVVDHWHWRGARSGPMGYAEDAAIDQTARIRDGQGTSPTKFIRSGGDRFREDQVALTGTGHAVLVNGFPRFVFNKGKIMSSGYVVPRFFLPNSIDGTMTNPYTEIPLIRSLLNNISLLVVHQDLSFDPVEKINSLDLGYLVWVATSSVSHLPAHLQNDASADFTTWKNFWASQTNITTVLAATAKLDQVYQEWVDAGNNAMITRSVAFIYNSDQHDIRSDRSFNGTRDEVAVILRRKLYTASVNDADLSALPSGGAYTISFAMHDSGSGSETHDISLPYELSNVEGVAIQAKQVSDILDVDWNTIPALDTHWIKQAIMPRFTNDWLRSGAHPGSSSIESTKCTTCHTSTSNVIFTDGVL